MQPKITQDLLFLINHIYLKIQAILQSLEETDIFVE